MRIVLVDDERPALDELAYQLEKFEEIQVVGQFSEPLIALKELERLMPDVVFLDIDMPVLNGLALATELLEKKKDISVVFVTAYHHYALQAFDVNAVDYVVKPVRGNRLQQTVEKLLNKNKPETRERSQLLHKLTEIQISMEKKTDKLVVFDGENYHLLPFEKILYIEARAKGVAVIANESVYSTKISISEMEARLVEKGFFRCHRSYILNPTHITKIIPSYNGTFQIKVAEKDTIPVSKTYAYQIKNILEE